MGLNDEQDSYDFNRYKVLYSDLIRLVIQVTQEAKDRMSFLERYEGFCVDLIKELAQEATLMLLS